MVNPKDDKYYLQRILTDLYFIESNTRNITSEELGVNEILLDSMMFRLIQISENSKKLSDEFKSTRQDIPWTAIYGLRNRIVHDYGHVDLSIIFRTIKEDIPALLALLEE